MTEANDQGDAGGNEKPSEGAAEPKGTTPGADQANSQEKTKDKPDSGQNEDG